MDMNGSEHIGAPVETVWRALNDPEILRRSIPGCQALAKLSETEMTATVVLKIGPLKATFHGSVELLNLNPPHAYTISGEGKGASSASPRAAPMSYSSPTAPMPRSSPTRSGRMLAARSPRWEAG